MRVIHVIKATGVAGAERHLLDLLPALRARGCDARLLVLTEPGKPMEDFLDAARARKVPAAGLTIVGDLDLSVPVRLWRRFRREKPDLVHTHLIHADFYGIPAARLARVPAVVTTRHNDDAFRRRFPGRWVNRWLWARTDGGIAVSQALAHFSREMEGAKVPIRVIHHGTAAVGGTLAIERDARGAEAAGHEVSGREAPGAEASQRDALEPIRAELGLTADALVVGMMCRLTAQKGVSIGLQAFAAIAHAFPQAILLIAGEGPERSELERTAAELGLSGSVRFLGWRADSGRILAVLDLLMAPSRWEGFGLVVLEAMARGVPVLATRVGALPEIIADGETGLLVAAGDVGALAAALGKLLGDAGLRARLGAAGRARARREFRLERMAEETLGFYEEVVRGRRER